MEDAVVLQPGSGPSEAARAAVSPDEFSRNAGARGKVALTFDGCYDARPVDSILATLQEKNWHATFFIAGRFAERFPSAVRRISGAGMEIGNHSWGHPAFTKLTDSQIREELSRTNALLENLTGRAPTLFRPPSGARDDRVRGVVSGEGYHNIYWSLDSWDAVQRGISAVEIRERVLSKVKPGDVVLLHIGSRPTAEALPGILDGLERRGLRVTPVSELMGAGGGA